MPRPSRMVLQLGVLLLCLIWGSTWLVISEGLEDLPPLTACGLRFLLTGAIFVLVAPRLARIEGGTRPTWSLRWVYAVLILAVPYGVIYWTETLLPSGLVSVLWSVYPILLAFIAHVLLPEERLLPRQWGGLLVGFLGVVSMFWTDVAAIGPEAIPMGLLLLVSPLVSAIGTPLIKRTNAHSSSVLLNRDGTLLGALLVCLAAWALEGDAEIDWTPRAIFSVVYLAVFGSAVAFGIYFWLLRHAPATYMSLVAFAVPLVALSLGAFVGGEEVRWHTVGGMMLILGGVALVVRGRR